jgi:hypothetical protein
MEFVHDFGWLDFLLELLDLGHALFRHMEVTGISVCCP